MYYNWHDYISLLTPLDDDVSERIWTEKDVSYKQLRVFGCRAYVYILKDERSKLDDKAKKCIFLNYGREKFRYRLWNPVARKLIRSTDVVFLEDQIIGNAENSDESQLSPEIHIIWTSVSLSVVHDDHWGAEDDNNDGPVEPVEQAPQNHLHH